jgi:hypothetical protein
MLAIRSKVCLITSFFFILCCFLQFFNKLDYIVTSHLFAETTLFVIFLKYRKITNYFIFLFWISFILATVVVFVYRDFTYSVITTLLKLFGYFMLLSYVYPKQKKIKNTGLDSIIYSVVVVINIYAVYIIIEMITPNITVKYMDVLFFVYGAVLILLYIFAYRYRLLRDAGSKYFLLLSTFLLVAEAVGVVAHFMDYRFLYYFEYFFYLFGLCFGLRAFIENKGDNIHKLIKTGNILS